MDGEDKENFLKITSFWKTALTNIDILASKSMYLCEFTHAVMNT